MFAIRFSGLLDDEPDFQGPCIYRTEIDQNGLQTTVIHDPTQEAMLQEVYSQLV